MGEHIAAIRALLEGAGLVVYDTTTPDSPKPPYVLLWSPVDGLPLERSVIASTDLDVMLGVTLVAATANGVRIMHDRAKAVLSPAGLPVTLTIPGRRATLHFDEARPITSDEDVTIPGTATHPTVGVTLYRLISTPA